MTLDVKFSYRPIHCTFQSAQVYNISSKRTYLILHTRRNGIVFSSMTVDFYTVIGFLNHPRHFILYVKSNLKTGMEFKTTFFIYTKSGDLNKIRWYVTKVHQKLTCNITYLWFSPLFKHWDIELSECDLNVIYFCIFLLIYLLFLRWNFFRVGTIIFTRFIRRRTE